MANYATLKSAIEQVIKTNGNNEITGALLQQSLLAMINSLGAGYQFVGIATPTTNPGTPDYNVFYIASTAGTYSNFPDSNNVPLVLNDGEIAILKYNGTWTKDVTGAATAEKVMQLGQEMGQEIDEIKDTYTKSGEIPNQEDLSIVDSNGYAIAIFNDGNVKTKGFDNKKPSMCGLGGSADLSIVDKNGNVIAELYDGNIKTKKFDSGVFNRYSVASPQFYLSDYLDGENLTNKTCSDVYSLYDNLCLTYPYYIQRVEDIGEDSRGIGIRHYIVRNQNPIVGTANMYTYETETKVNSWKTYFNYKRILLVSGAHGDEKSAVYGLYYLIAEMLGSDEPWARYILSNAELDIIPILNLWGFDNNSRNSNTLIPGSSDQYVNINRDYFTQYAPETQAITAYIDSIGSDIQGGIDCHATSGNYGYVAAQEINPEFPQIMKIANYIFGGCVGSWDNLATDIGLSTQYRPYMYGCISKNTGTFYDYLRARGYTNNGVTAECIKVSGVNMNKVCKFTKDIVCNLIQSFLNI